MTAQAITVVVVGDLEAGQSVGRALEEASAPGYSLLFSSDPGGGRDLARTADADVIVIDSACCTGDISAVVSRLREPPGATPVIVLLAPDQVLPPDSLRDVSAVVVRGPTEGATLPFAIRQALSDSRCSEFVSLLTGPIAHDLRSPLGVIGLAAQLLEGVEHVEEVPPLTKKILNASRRLDWNVRDLAEFGSLRFSQPVDLDRQQSDLLAAVGERLAEMQMDFPRRVIELRATGKGSGNWDIRRILQILRSVIETVLRSSPPASAVVVEVDARAEDEVSIVVSARGLLVTARIREALRASPATARLGRNHDSAEMPFGLLSVYALSRALGGHVELDESGPSPTLRITLPRS